MESINLGPLMCHMHARYTKTLWAAMHSSGAMSIARAGAIGRLRLDGSPARWLARCRKRSRVGSVGSVGGGGDGGAAAAGAAAATAARHSGRARIEQKGSLAYVANAGGGLTREAGGGVQEAKRWGSYFGVQGGVRGERGPTGAMEARSRGPWAMDGRPGTAADG